MYSFRKFLEAWQPMQITPEDYSGLLITADYVEDHPEELPKWFQQFRGVFAVFLQRIEKLESQFNDHWVDEPEDDPLEEMKGWIGGHLLHAIDRVLSLAHNGPLFSVAQAVKNTYEGLSKYLAYSDYYESNDEESTVAIDLINKETRKLVEFIMKLLKEVFPIFLRVAKLRFKPDTAKNSFERLSSTPKFD